MPKKRYHIFLVLFLATAFKLYAQEEAYVVEDQNISSEEFIPEYDTTDRLIDEAVQEKNKKKQQYLSADSTSKTSVEYKAIDKEKWEKYHNERDYIEKEKKKEEAFEMPSFGFEGLGFIAQLIKLIVYAVVVLGLAFLIFKLFEARYKENKSINKDKGFKLEKLEEQIHEVDLEKLLAAYTRQQDFAMMIRIQYLIILKELSRRKIINWQKQKTNGAYLQELYGHNLFGLFQKVTRLYERIWFGEVSLDEQKYKEIVPNFEQMLAQTKKINIG